MGSIQYDLASNDALRRSRSSLASPETECVDLLGRPLKDLRLSVIDQCNFRCTYCMPKDVFTKDYPFLTSSEILSFDQMTLLAESFVRLGVEKIRITGGEPLLRKNLEFLIERLARLKTRDGEDVEISLTTNGALLAKKAAALRNAGLRRVTVSLDALDDHVFGKMNGVGFPVGKVLHGIETAVAVGLEPVKVNMVVERGANDGQVLPIAEYFRNTGVTVRFIEFMDVGGAQLWDKQKVVPSDEIRHVIESAHPLLPVEKDRLNDTAINYEYSDGAGKIGFISSVSKPFCGNCTRARVSADGQLFLCLFATNSVDLKPLLGEIQSPLQLASEIRKHWNNRDDQYSSTRSAAYSRTGKKTYPTVRMSLVGG
ncbi:MAG: 3,8-cyclase [Paraburkholderia sp.]|nr:3,8-cyclase [Paraburkholderia sp.]